MRTDRDTAYSSSGLTSVFPKHRARKKYNQSLRPGFLYKRKNEPSHRGLEEIHKRAVEKNMYMSLTSSSRPSYEEGLANDCIGAVEGSGNVPTRPQTLLTEY
jgi:hypothetical protein